MRRKRKTKRPGPLYLIAILWLFWSVALPLYSGSHFFLLFLVSFFLYRFAKKKIWPDIVIDTEAEEKERREKELAEERRRREQDERIREASRRAAEAATVRAVRETEERMRREAEQLEAERAAAEAAAKIDPDSPINRPVPKRKRTGDAAIDKMLEDEEQAIKEMHRLDDSILDEKLSNQIVHLEEVTTKIVDYIVEHPNKKSQVKRFFTYYLPTSLKLLNAYDRMDETGISGMNIDGTKEKVDAMMDTALAAFDKQLDALYAEEALDISSDIKVMESMLAQEGLTEDGMREHIKI